MKNSNYIVRGNEQGEVWMLGYCYLALRETPEYSVAVGQVPYSEAGRRLTFIAGKMKGFSSSKVK